MDQEWTPKDYSLVRAGKSPSMRLMGLGSRQQRGTIGGKPVAPISPNTHKGAELHSGADP